MPQPKTHWKLNTSNQGKFEEFRHLFASRNCTLQATHLDLEEIEADPVTVAVHKASQLGDHIIIDDTSLEVEGADVGINVRWILEHLENFVGKLAFWRVLLAYRENDQVYVFQGTVRGTIVKPRGEAGFGFDKFFMPEGSIHTLAEAKPDACNARAVAVEALLKNNPLSIHPAIHHWDGSWQSPRSGLECDN